ncbi:hypothetical protein BAUCODRAFT_151255 [Baudoinia panamericana UAMH 10762]|uniref:DOMON domain-containing protein n=1 Tax=Baudoinia panamericana (strain UAMH 10762) TaxID=717646 RepID=M2N1M5_BAUPA|nr:uncharacterized protein BAUCODRAFT_151255 [Baudoinia panamericana UAMH 10762]EMC92859.1 hypothetical protein BAUCODRAFT_151255 [Baudoinia panamericana UAMH 10762]
MRTTTALALLLAFLCHLSSGVSQEHTVDIFAWPVSAVKSQSLARISYNSTAATIKSYTPLSVADNDDVVRVGFYHPSGSWSGIATSASNLAPGRDKKLQLHLNSDGEVYHLGFKTLEYGTSSKTSNKKDDLSVEVMKIKPGPTPHLNKPVVLNPDGTVGDKEPEKTFLQKYWWAIAGFLVLQLVMNGAKQE